MLGGNSGNPVRCGIVTNRQLRCTPGRPRRLPATASDGRRSCGWRSRGAQTAHRRCDVIARQLNAPVPYPAIICVAAKGGIIGKLLVRCRSACQITVLGLAGLLVCRWLRPSTWVARSNEQRRPCRPHVIPASWRPGCGTGCCKAAATRKTFWCATIRQRSRSMLGRLRALARTVDELASRLQDDLPLLALVQQVRAGIGRYRHA